MCNDVSEARGCVWKQKSGPNLGATGTHAIAWAHLMKDEWAVKEISGFGCGDSQCNRHQPRPLRRPAKGGWKIGSGRYSAGDLA